MRLLAISLLALVMGAPMARAQGNAVPPELAKTFERYARAWKDADWGRIFEVNAPVFKKALLDEFGSRDAWIRHQSADFKDTILSYERVATYRLASQVYTFATVVKGRRPDKSEFSAEGYATFELMEGTWYLVTPVAPGNLNPSRPGPAPETGGR